MDIANKVPVWGIHTTIGSAEARVAEPIDPAAPDLDPVPVLIPVRSYQFKYRYWENSKRREGLLLALY